MKKEVLAKKAFESALIQKSWQVHTRAFGPILEPAFMDNYHARIDLTAALNYISNRDVKNGLEKLHAIQKSCSTEADKAAWLFCAGLCYEMANMREEMLACYQEAGEYGHKFYLPFLKVAKTAHNDAVFETAEENYKKAIQSLLEDEHVEQRNIILGAAYTNYASCLTMMHRYEEAEETLKKSAEILPEQKERAAAEAILAAAQGNAVKAHDCTEILKTQAPFLYETTQDMVRSILENRHPQFSCVAIKDGVIEAFWNWFVSSESALLEELGLEEYDKVVKMIMLKLKEVFPFMERDPEFGIKPEEEFYQITFADYYMVSLEYGYHELIKSVPKRLLSHWGFDIAH